MTTTSAHRAALVASGDLTDKGTRAWHDRDQLATEMLAQEPCADYYQRASDALADGGSPFVAWLWLELADDAWSEPDGAQEPWQVTDAEHVLRHGPQWHTDERLGRAL